MKIIDKVVELAWSLWSLVVASVVVVAFISLLFTLFVMGVNCGMKDECVEKVFQISDALGVDSAD